MLLGHANTPYCLEPVPAVRKEQKEYLKKIVEEFVDGNVEIRKSIDHVCVDKT